jgi:tRNA pseudouridine38-40 synthase
VPGVRLTLAYDGTRFAGFQRQRPPPGQGELRTVQGALEAAIARITGAPVTVRGASRTDAGVHAEGQVVAFDSARELPPRRWLLAINRYLPEDVAVQAAAECAPGYEPRFDAVDKTYRYLYHLGLARDPLLQHRTWQLARSGAPPDDTAAPYARSGPLDLDAMRAAAAQLLGTHDFRAFRAADDERDNTVRTLHRVELLEDFHERKNLLALEVRGSAFMKNMVRIISGTLIAVGRQKLTASDVPALLGERAVRTRHMETAPAHGLTLLRVTLGRSPAPACR